MSGGSGAPDQEDLQSPETASPAPSGSGSGDTSRPEAPGASVSSSEAALGWNILTDSGGYTVTGRVEDRPEDCMLLGLLSLAGPGVPSPSTDKAEYVDCPVWAAPDGAALYVELPGGGYVLAELVQP